MSADLLAGGDHQDVGGVDLRFGVAVLEPPLVPDHLDGHGARAALGQIEDRVRTVGTAIPARIRAGMTVHAISSSGVAVDLAWFLATGCVTEQEDGHQDRRLGRARRPDGDPEDRPEEVVDRLGERACRLEGGQRLILAAEE